MKAPAKEIAAWVKNEQGKHLCACGCGKPVNILPRHYFDGAPRVVHGHNARLRRSEAQQWIDRNQGKHFCQCGCGNPILIQIHHHVRGIPRYLNHHFTPPALLGRRREKNGKYKGGRYINKSGYAVVLVGTTATGQSIYKLEHRLIMEKMLGRELSDKESVHHKDGNRANNSLGNLELWTSKHRGGQRVVDLIESSAALLAGYLHDEGLWPEKTLWLRDLMLAATRP